MTNEDAALEEKVVQFLAGKCPKEPSHDGDCGRMTEGEARQIVTLLTRGGFRIVEK